MLHRGALGRRKPRPPPPFCPHSVQCIWQRRLRCTELGVGGGGTCNEGQVPELETTRKMILQMGKQRLERGSDSAGVTQPVSGRSKPVATGRGWAQLGTCALQPLARSRWASQSVGADSWISKSSESYLEGRGPPLRCTHIWAFGEDDMGVLAPEWEPCLPTSRQPPLQPPPQGLQGPAALAGSPTHPQNIWLAWARLG